MLVGYAATEMGSLDEYLDAAPKGKSIRGNGITTYLLHVAQCINFHNSLQQQLLPRYCWSHFIQGLVSRLLKISQILLILKRLASDFIMGQEDLKQIRKKLLAYNVYKPSNDVLHFFMTIELTWIYIKMCSEIYMLIQNQKIGFQINILKLRSRRY